MGKVSLRMMFLALLCMNLCGCIDAIVSLVSPQEKEVVDLTGLRYWDPEGKPRLKPGVGVWVQVGSTGLKPVEMEAQVDSRGEVALPYLLTEPVLCDGLTIEAFQQKLVKIYQKYIKQPLVTVRFTAFDLKTGVSPYGTVNVLGQVNSPGPVNMPPTMDLTVTKALMAAGNTRQFADKSKVQVTRCDKDGQRTVTIVDLDEIGKEGRIDKDMQLRPGDVVYVYERLW